VAARVDYETHGNGYARGRQTDPRIATRIHAALGDARTVLNVGAGTGFYEPRDRWVLAVEPSATMRAQRPAEAAPCIDASAESLPFDDDSVDAAMACLTIHHWPERARGLAEMRRVARGPVVVFTFDLAAQVAWLRDYLAAALALDEPCVGTPAEIAAELGGKFRVESIPTPADCVDGFIEAFWSRPEALLDPLVRDVQSVWEKLEPQSIERIFSRLAADLESGRWDEEHGQLRRMESYAGALRLIISEQD
jgi:SAM-dependent methyltransferase